MAAAHDPDEGIWGRVLLASLGLGLAGLGLALSVLMTVGEDAAPSDGLHGLAMAGVGAVGLVAAAIGRAFGRWALAGVGLLFLAQAAQIGLELATYREALGRSTVAALAALVILGVAAISVAVWQIAAHGKRARTLQGA